MDTDALLPLRPGQHLLPALERDHPRRAQFDVVAVQLDVGAGRGGQQVLGRRGELDVGGGADDAHLGLGGQGGGAPVRAGAERALRGVQGDAALLVGAAGDRVAALGVQHQPAGHRQHQVALAEPVQCAAGQQRGLGARHPHLVGRGQAHHACLAAAQQHWGAPAGHLAGATADRAGRAAAVGGLQVVLQGLQAVLGRQGLRFAR